MVERKAREKEHGTAHVQPADDDEDALAEIPLDVAVNEPLTFKTFVTMISKPYTWLPTLMCEFVPHQPFPAPN